MRFRTMTFAVLLTSLLATAATAAPPPPGSQAQRVTITRDNWGIAHVEGETDADAVFGMIYAQAEDDFNRIETNYLVSLGRLAEAEGEKAIWSDLRARLYMDPADLSARYRASPAWLKKLMEAWADGLNHYLATHPDVRPRVIKRFEPWMTLSFSEGSIGGDIERISLDELEAFYSSRAKLSATETSGDRVREPTGSNGFAIAPSRTRGGKALLLINPHTSFFFRSELQMRSREGLNVYGAATWGQFFIYQGFNERVGFMHTSSGVDVVDEFAETIVRRGGRLHYRYGREERPLRTTTITVAYRTADGGRASRSFETYSTHHGPVVRRQGDTWIAFAMMHRPVEALSQSYLRTKARDYAGFAKVMEYKANSSNNTIFADASGNIAYLHPQFIPRRDDRFDYTKPVDGSDPATDWRGPHALGEAPNLLNPAGGWIQNTNNWPWSAAGANSRKAALYPRYMDSAGENPRGIHAQALLARNPKFTLETLRDAAYDTYLVAFADLIPKLVADYDRAPGGASKRGVAKQVALLRAWNYRWSADSVPTSLAVFWAEEMVARVAKGQWGRGMTTYQAIAAAPARQKFAALAAASAKLTRDFGSWRTPWGEINRFQRISPEIDHPFSDPAPSLPVGFASARWGSLAAFGALPGPGTKRWYGTRGNSFVAVVEFGKRVRAIAVTAGGASGDPTSRHFNDQALRYATGDLRPVYFHPDEIEAHAQRRYRPGE